jgi:ribulose-5-phosphate 4-epimerase/fuculose-1-phosphate aldolase
VERLRGDDVERCRRLLDALRALDALHERSPGVFYRSSSPFLHFHGTGADLCCDLKVGTGWLRYPVGKVTPQSIVIADVRKVLRGKDDGLRGRPTSPPRTATIGGDTGGVGRTGMADLELEKLMSSYLPTFDNVEEERLHRKQRLAAAFRLFGKFGFDEGVAGHITMRDPELLDHFWVNPIGMSFGHIRVSDLILVNDHGEVVEGAPLLNQAAFAIHSQVHAARPDVVAAAHAHSLHGKAWSSLGRTLDPLTQDACAFYDDHSLFDDYTGVVLDLEEGKRIAYALGDRKAVILRNHGLLTVGQSVDEAAWWFITMERTCQAQLLAEAAGTPVHIDAEHAQLTAKQVGGQAAGWFSFQPMYNKIVREQPDLFD